MLDGGKKKPLTITQPGMGKPQGNKEDDQLMEFKNFRKQPLSQSAKNLLMQHVPSPLSAWGHDSTYLCS